MKSSEIIFDPSTNSVPSSGANLTSSNFTTRLNTPLAQQNTQSTTSTQSPVQPGVTTTTQQDKDNKESSSTNSSGPTASDPSAQTNQSPNQPQANPANTPQDTSTSTNQSGDPAQGAQQPSSPPTQVDTTINGLSGSWEDGYTVKTKKGILYIKNPKIPGTILKYQNVIQNPANSSIDFSEATTLKDELIDVLKTGDLAKATELAIALGGKLRKLVKQNTVPTPEQTNDVGNVTFNARVRRNGNVYEIKIGNDFKEIPFDIMKTLRKYKRVYDSLDGTSFDFTPLAVLKDSIRRDVVIGNFDKAKQTASELQEKLNELEKKVPKPTDTNEKIKNHAEWFFIFTSFRHPERSPRSVLPSRIRLGRKESLKHNELSLNYLNCAPLTRALKILHRR
jgi:hypothetical protein